MSEKGPRLYEEPPEERPDESRVESSGQMVAENAGDKTATENERGPGTESAEVRMARGNLEYAINRAIMRGLRMREKPEKNKTLELNLKLVELYSRLTPEQQVRLERLLKRTAKELCRQGLEGEQLLDALIQVVEDLIRRVLVAKSRR